MQTRPIQLTDVTYNAATQCFEALVTVQDGEQLRRYACAIDAPITMSYRDAADGLSRQALRRHAQKRGLSSEVLRHVPAQRRFASTRVERQRFSSRSMPRSTASIR